jgi:hypothetical protein
MDEAAAPQRLADEQMTSLGLSLDPPLSLCDHRRALVFAEPMRHLPQGQDTVLIVTTDQVLLAGVIPASRWRLLAQWPLHQTFLLPGTASFLLVRRRFSLYLQITPLNPSHVLLSDVNPQCMHLFSLCTESYLLECMSEVKRDQCVRFFEAAAGALDAERKKQRAAILVTTTTATDPRTGQTSATYDAVPRVKPSRCVGHIMTPEQVALPSGFILRLFLRALAPLTLRRPRHTRKSSCRS